MINFEGRDAGNIAAIPTLESLDHKWYSRLEALYFEDYTLFSGDPKVRAEALKSFIAGETQNPTLDYPKLEAFNLVERNGQLLELKLDILENETNEVVKKIYRVKINEMLAVIRMLNAAKNRDDKTFKKYSEFLYGKPNIEHANYVCEKILDEVNPKLNSEDENEKNAAQRIFSLVSNAPASESEMVSDDILPNIEKDKTPVTSIEEVMQRSIDALKESGIDDWDVILTTNSAFSADQESKKIMVPESVVEKISKGKFTLQHLNALIAHEIQTHALRRHNGERTKLKLLGLGLDRYLRGEEGVATFNQQNVEGATQFAGVGYYFCIGIASGFFDGVQRDFRETFNLVRDYYYLKGKRGPDKMEIAQKNAWSACVRVFRGSTCQTPGVTFNKDLAYLGNREIWTLVSKNSDVVQNFSIGKYDPTRPDHVALLEQLGILDDEVKKD